MTTFERRPGSLSHHGSSHPEDRFLDDVAAEAGHVGGRTRRRKIQEPLTAEHGGHINRERKAIAWWRSLARWIEHRERRGKGPGDLTPAIARHLASAYVRGGTSKQALLEEHAPRALELMTETPTNPNRWGAELPKRRPARTRVNWAGD